MKEYKPILNVEEISPVLKKISIFKGISNVKLNKLVKHLKKVEYEDSEVIFSQGSAPTQIYIIKKGRVKLVEYFNYTPYQLFELGEGNCIGEASIIGIQTHEVTAISKGNTEFIVLPKKILLEIFETDKELFCLLVLNIAKEVSKRLAKTDNILLQYIDKYKYPN
ncbi:cyclic nucleotide-binding domain-containing protein [uncultured Ilyobacter sp.]|uniref:cyclic nucleotide-binding domain-containing protein n=1 Tax=uncultured Ilyobacter sp. TaxID=544433 RepID=UPI0029C7A7F6|nr:cyclic nucleotide-binding domain-containing protein [uncultured Ilyobacter sp.]